MTDYKREDLIPTEFKIESPKSTVFITLHSQYARARVITDDMDAPVSYPHWLSMCLSKIEDDARYIIIPKIERDGEQLPIEITEVFKNG